jgi:Site-specific recombinase XerD
MSEAQSADPEESIGYFLEDLTYQGKSQRTRDAYERALRRFEEFLSNPAVNPRNESVTPVEASHRDCMAFVHTLRDDLASSTVASYAAYLHRFYAYMTQVGAFTDNPMAIVTEEMNESIDSDPVRRDIAVPQMREFVSTARHPLEQAVIVTLLKTGIRVGELCNIDLRDITVSDSELTESFDIGSRGALDSRPDSLYVSSEPTVNQEYAGEIRPATNKRKRDTVIPIDTEFQRVLKRWLLVRPDARSETEPLFVDTESNWGARLTPPRVRTFITRHAREYGWYQTGGGASENVTPHYFRHFFTTHLRDRTGDRGVVKYLRGDVADDVIDTYTHNWGDQVRRVYEQHIYSLF